jgi:hypothetical protein
MEPDERENSKIKKKTELQGFQKSRQWIKETENFHYKLTPTDKADLTIVNIIYNHKK